MIKTLLEWTAWPMAPPKPYGLFHITAAAAGLAAAFLAARFLAGRKLRYGTKRRLLLVTGILLLLLEVYKQLFLYEIVNGGHYDWWYFPFQLCSLPLYLCPLMVISMRKHRRLPAVIGTFMMDFNLLGGLMALAEPSGLMHPYVTLTLHGFLWHIIIVFLGLYIGFTGLGDKSRRGFWGTLPILAISAAAATVCNVAFHTLGEISMFYISPYEPSTQVVFRSIALRWGTMAGIVSYLAAMVLGAFAIHRLWSMGEVKTEKGKP